MTIAGADLYPTIAEKAAALGFSLIMNGFEIRAPVGEQEQVVLHVASGELERDGFTAWLKTHIIQRS